MEVLTKLGLFLILFAVIVFGSRFLLSRNTKQQIKEIGDPLPTYFQSQNRMMMRFIIVLVLVVIGLYIIFALRSPQ